MRNETLRRRPFRFCRIIIAMLILVTVVGIAVVNAGSSFAADGKNGANEGLSSLEPRQMAAECRAKEKQLRDALPRLRKLVQENEKLQDLLDSLVSEQEFYTKLLNERRKIIEKRKEEAVGTDDKLFRNRLSRLYSSLEEAGDTRRKINRNEKRIKEILKLPPRLEGLVSDLSTETMASLEADLRKLSHRCDTLERLAKLAEDLQKQGPPPKAAPEQDKTEIAPRPLPPKRDAAARQGEAAQSNKTPSTGKRSEQRGHSSSQKQAGRTEQLPPHPEDEARADIKEARRYYNEARAFDVENKKGHAADSYRVAMSLLTEAKEKSKSEERRRKIDKVLANLSKRIANLPGGATAQDEQARNRPAQMSLRKAGNAECAAQFQGAVMLKPKDGGNGFWCACPKGRMWNKSKTACIKASGLKQLGRAACAKRYRNSVFVGVKNGLAQCRCPRGRQFNRSRTACVRAPRVSNRQSREAAKRQAEAAYNLGVLLGQALRSRSGGSTPRRHCHRRPDGSIHCGSN